jgi:hypothetical protein
MKGYIYRLYKGADPSEGWIFNDPIFGSPPTLGACVPNIRRVVEPDDWVFCISGRVPGYVPYVVGGFRVQEKINALEAHKRFPQYRLHKGQNGQVLGNVIVDSAGSHHPLDDHSNFESRLDNYLVGADEVCVSSENVERAREETLPTLSDIFKKPGNRSYDIVPRLRKLDENQVEHMRDWLADLSK